MAGDALAHIARHEHPCQQERLRSRARTTQSLELTVGLQQLDPVICGRAQEPRRAEAAQVTVRTAPGCEILGCALAGGRLRANRTSTHPEQA